MADKRKGMSMRAYAAHAGVSLGAIQKAKSSGRLVLHDDGSIDAAASDKRRAALTDPSKQRGRPAARRKAVADDGGDALGGVSGGNDATTFLKARTANEVLKAQDRRLTIERKKGVLVERVKAERLVFRLAREERDSWVNWPARAAALMCADLASRMERAGGDPVEIEPAAMQAVLEKHVRDQLESLAEINVSLA